MSDQGSSSPVVLNGRYELRRRIARGGMAEVYLARDQMLDRPVAIKVLYPEFAADPAFVERFRREAQAAANLNHPSIVGVYDGGTYGGTNFIVLEYVRGRTLAEELAEVGRLAPDRVAEVGAAIAGALSFAHRSGVVHRDVKPGNVLISAQGEVKVTDFGIARAAANAEDNLTQVGAVMGTATYFSPEQAQGRPVDPRSDLYSLGVVLYELLVGRPPFVAETPLAVAYQHVQDPVPSPRAANPAVPAGLDAIVVRLLQKDPAGRYESADALRADLQRFREGRNISAAPLAGGVAGAAAGVVAGAGAAGAAGVDQPTQALLAATAVHAYGQVRGEDGSVDTRLGTPMREMPGEPSKYRSPAFVGAMVGLGALVVLLAFGLISLLGGGEAAARVEVPAVTSRTVEEATAALEALGFKVERRDQKNDAVPIGQVISQDPRAGTLQAEGSTITLVVSAEASSLTVPSVVGKSLSEAQRALAGAGFDVAKIVVTTRDDDKAERDVVLEQVPAANSKVPAGQQIQLVVAKGVGDIRLPNVAGKTCDEAIALLKAAGVKENKIICELVADDTVPDTKAIRTDPSGSVTTAQTVKVLISTGKPVVTVPSVVGLTQGAAESLIIGAGLVPQVVTEAGAGSAVVLTQTPAAGTQARKGDVVTIKVRVPSGSTTTTS